MQLKISRRSLVKSAAAASLAASAASLPLLLTRRRPPPRENIILIVCDAMRADALSASFNSRPATPAISALADSATNFTNAFSAAPGTKFSMASILSGLYPPAHGIEHYRFTLPDCNHLARYLSSKGYYCLSVVTNPYLAPEIGPAGSRSMGFGFADSFDYYYYLRNELDAPPKPLPPDIANLAPYIPGTLVNSSLEMLLDRKVPLFAADKPLFIYLHYMDSHQPWLQARPYPSITGSFHPDGPTPPDKAFPQYVAAVNKLLFSRTPPEEFTPADLALLAAAYYEAALYTDRRVADALSLLDTRGLLDSAALIITADHGDELFEHGRIGHAKNMFNPALRVPLVIKHPSLPTRTVPTRVSNASILPTVMEWFGDELPSSPLPSLSPYARDLTLPPPPVFASMFGWDKIITPDSASAIFRKGELLHFDLASDPAESIPLPPGPAAVDAMKKARAVSARLARDAGLTPAFSTHAWQNSDVPTQNALAQAAVDRGEMTPLSAALAKSRGAFIPGLDSRDLTGETQIDPASLSPEAARQLKALGYLN